MHKLQVFDPAMCCSTGVCGPNPDPVLPRFVADLQWLANHGIAVERYNLAQQPQAFATRSCLINRRGAKRRVSSGAKAQFLLGLNVGAKAPTPGATIYEMASSELVKTALVQYGNDCLPLILVDGAIVSRGSYPTRKQLATFAELSDEEAPSLYTGAVAELVAIGASIAANCEPCLKFHFDKARKLGVSVEDMARAVDTAQMVKENPARSVLGLANRLLQRHKTAKDLPIAPSSCCTPGTTVPSTGSEGCCG